MRHRHIFAPPLPAALLPLLVLIMSIPLSSHASGGLLPPGGRILSSDEKQLELSLLWEPGAMRELPDGLYLSLDACRLEGEEGAPMLPHYRALLALPPGQRAVLSWRLLASRPLAGEPLPFPTARAFPAGPDEHFFLEELVRNPDLFARSYPIDARLGNPHRLRDHRVLELDVSPIAWDPVDGLRLATEIAVTIRFLPDPAGRSRSREPLRRADKLWEPVYRASLLNGGEAGTWRTRVPASPLAPRALRAEAALRLRLEKDGLYGLSGAELIAAGIPAGNALDQIALYRHSFYWDVLEQPVFEEVPVARFFLDREENELLDDNDLMIFMGRGLRHAEESPDSIEWFGTGSALWVGLAPGLAWEMATEPGWEDEAGSYPLLDRYTRHQRAYSAVDYYVNITQDYYIDAPGEYWRDNCYFFKEPFALESYVTDLDVPSPGYLGDSSTRLEMLWKGRSLNTNRYFSLELQNVNGSAMLPEVTVPACSGSCYDVLYSESIAPGLFADGENTITVDRTNGNQWSAKIKWWDLAYESAYRAREDSLFFHADWLAGPAEIRVGGLSQGVDNWLLLRSSEASPLIEAPTRILLEAENEAGVPGDYELRFRDQLAGHETWWLVDEERLLSPTLETPAALHVLDDPGSYDVLVIAHDDFAPGMERWVSFREAQGYRIRLLSASETWEAFFAGCRGAVGIRNAARYAYQQWGAEVLLLVGDSNKDARVINQYADPDFLPMHSIHEIVGGVNEITALEEWVVKFEWDSWPSMLMGRLPVGSVEELDIILDKIECYETYEDVGDCRGAGDWRKRFLMISDDNWSYGGIGSCSEARANELNFELGQMGAIEIINGSVPGDIVGLPFFESAVTVPWYEERSVWDDCIDSYDIQGSLRLIISAIFIDSLSQGYSVAAVQAHANRYQLAHEEFFKTGYGGHDQEDLTNWGQPYYWLAYGCHPNNFAAFNEGSSSNGDCIGEQMLFIDGGRGAVASYGSEGFEYLWPNVELGHDLLELMFWTEDTEGTLIFPEWRLGTLQIVSELRYGESHKTSSFRYNLLGDPLTRIDAAPPRIELYINRQHMGPDDFVPPASTGDTLHVEALIRDENYIHTLRLRDLNLGDIPFEVRPLWCPWRPDGAMIIDVSDPADPAIMGSVDTPGHAWGITIAGGFAYVADGEEGLQVLEIVPPSAPVIVGSVDTPGNALAVAISGDYAYVADDESGLQVLDVSVPSNPLIAASLDTPGSARAVSVLGGYAYLADGAAGLQVLDISTPASPVIIGSVETPGLARDVAIAGTYAYVAAGAAGLQVVDVSTPGNPTIIGSVATPGESRGVVLSGDQAFVAAGGGGLQVIDISIPASPAVVGSTGTPGYAWAVAISNDQVYVADELSGLQVVDVSLPASPAIIGSQDTPGYARDVAFSNFYAYVAQGTGPLDSLLGHTDTPIVDILAPIDTLAASTLGRSRAWYLSADVPYDFALEELIVEGTDIAGQTGAFHLPLAKAVEFFLAGSDSLRHGQWVRAQGELLIKILVPSEQTPASSFKIMEDGVLRSDAIVEPWKEDDDPAVIIYAASMPYEWDAGEHNVTVLFEEEGYGAIILRVDDSARLLSGVVFPNPFRNVVTLHYELTGEITSGNLSIYSLSGRLVHRQDLLGLSEGDQHFIEWDGRDRAGDRIANGVYISRLVFTDTRGEKLVWEDKVVKMR